MKIYSMQFAAQRGGGFLTLDSSTSGLFWCGLDGMGWDGAGWAGRAGRLGGGQRLLRLHSRFACLVSIQMSFALIRIAC